jgi:hypothetical protein
MCLLICSLFNNSVSIPDCIVLRLHCNELQNLCVVIAE